MPIGHGNLFWLVVESHGKVMEIDFPKRVVTLEILFSFLFVCVRVQRNGYALSSRASIQMCDRLLFLLSVKNYC